MKLKWRALDKNVLVVAKEGAIGDWAAYIGAVPGNNHHDEYERVAALGSKLPESIANELFPSYKSWDYRG